MAIEVMKTTAPVIYQNLSTVMYELAVFLSASTNFRIIDSYGAGAGRHKGDPITGAAYGWWKRWVGRSSEVR